MNDSDVLYETPSFPIFTMVGLRSRPITTRAEYPRDTSLMPTEFSTILKHKAPVTGDLKAQLVSSHPGIPEPLRADAANTIGLSTSYDDGLSISGPTKQAQIRAANAGPDTYDSRYEVGMSHSKEDSSDKFRTSAFAWGLDRNSSLLGPFESSISSLCPSAPAFTKSFSFYRLVPTYGKPVLMYDPAVHHRIPLMVEAGKDLPGVELPLCVEWGFLLAEPPTEPSLVVASAYELPKQRVAWHKVRRYWIYVLKERQEPSCLSVGLAR